MLKPEDILSIQDVELAFSTMRFLPEPKDIPEAFYDNANPYAKVAEAIMFGLPMPEGEVTFKEGFQEAFASKGMDFLSAHLQSYGPKHEDKIAGVGYLISQMMTIEAPSPSEVNTPG